MKAQSRCDIAFPRILVLVFSCGCDVLVPLVGVETIQLTTKFM